MVASRGERRCLVKAAHCLRPKSLRITPYRPFMSPLYFLAEIVAGWVGWLSIGTIVLVPIWASLWSRVERTIIPLTGVPRIEPRSSGWPSRLREIAHLMVVCLVALLGTAAYSWVSRPIWEGLRAPFVPEAAHLFGFTLLSGGQRIAGFMVASTLLIASFWTSSLLGWGLASISSALLSPHPENLQKQVDDLISKVVESEDEMVLERRHLEQQLHDGAQVHLTAAVLRVAVLELELAKGGQDCEATLGSIRVIRDEIEAAGDAVRNIAHGLTPVVLSERGLGAALQDMLESLSVACRLEAAGPAFYGPVAEDLYYIASEALSNAIRHGGAEQIEVGLNVGSTQVTLSISDDGIGGAIPRGRGLLGMKVRAERRGGSFAMSSPEGGPTVIVVTVPWKYYENLVG